MGEEYMSRGEFLLHMNKQEALERKLNPSEYRPRLEPEDVLRDVRGRLGREIMDIIMEEKMSGLDDEKIMSADPMVVDGRSEMARVEGGILKLHNDLIVLIGAADRTAIRIGEQTDWLQRSAEESDRRYFADKEEARLDKERWDKEATNDQIIAALGKLEGLLNMLVNREWMMGRQEFPPVGGRELLEAVYDCHNQQEAYHSLIANAIEKVRYMVMNQQIEDLSTAELKKELKRRKKLSRGSV
jgi:hypothetical protein